MRLIELSPRWLLRDGKRVGIIFQCPLPKRRLSRQTCFFVGMKWCEQCAVVRSTFGLGALHEDDEPDLSDVQLCKDDIAWKVHVPPAQTNPPNFLDPELATFESLTITPSLDGSAGGNWHGSITNGAIVGGI